MSLENIFLSSVLVIATACAVIKFALHEWEGVLKVWRRVSATHKNLEKRNRDRATKAIYKGTRYPC